MAGSATYLYCVVRSAKPPAAARAPRGLAGATRPAAVAAGRSLWIITGEVPLDTYGPAALERALRDMQWVADVAVAHEAVVEHFARQAGSTVIPMKLFTMFSTVKRAVAGMKARRKTLDEVFVRIAGCEEWGVRLTRTAAAVAAAKRPAARATSGAAFLAAKRAARDAAREAVRTAAATADTAFDALAALARDARRRDDVPEGATPPLLDAAFLVPSTGRSRFRAAARQLAAGATASGAEMTLTGPWPAYNFVQADPR